MVRVVAGFIEDGGKILLVKRPWHKKRGGLWEFPGGKIEDNETPQEALKRELREELGVEILPHEIIIKKIHAYPDEVIELILIKATLLGEPILKEVVEMRWVDLKDLEKIELCPADKEVLRALELEKRENEVKIVTSE